MQIAEFGTSFWTITSRGSCLDRCFTAINNNIPRLPSWPESSGVLFSMEGSCWKNRGDGVSAEEFAAAMAAGMLSLDISKFSKHVSKQDD